MLGLTLGCLVVGGSLHLAGAVVQGDLAWAIGGIAGAAYSLWTMIDSLRRGRLGVDAIAFLALVGALAVGEYLAAVVVAVMAASGRSLEGWAAGRASHDMRSLLQRAPRTAHRYEGEALSTVQAQEVGPGDRGGALLVTLGAAASWGRRGPLLGPARSVAGRSAHAGTPPMAAPAAATAEA